jgi:hypothetical protein
MDAVVHQNGASCIVASWGPVTISVWRGAVNTVDLQVVSNTANAVAATHPSAQVSITVASTSIKPPDEAVRKKIIELRATGKSTNLKGSVVILAGDGLWASVMRSMLAGLNLVGVVKNESYVRTLTEASTLAAKLVPGLDGAALEAVLVKLCADAGVKL